MKLNGRWRLVFGAIVLLPLAALAQAPTRTALTLEVVAGNRALWPASVITKTAIVAQPLVNGVPGPSIKVPDNEIVKLIRVDGATMQVEYQGKLLVVPSAQTDLLAGAAALSARQGAARPTSISPVTPSGPAADSIFRAAALAMRERRFQDLEALAGRVASGRELSSEGRPELEEFFSGVTSGQPKISDGWPPFLRGYDEWIGAAPGSVVARVAKAIALARYAWFGRGSGYANSVTKEGWQMFAQRIEESRAVLDNCRSSAANCPHWFVAMLVVARAQGWDRAKAIALFEDGRKTAPFYHPIYHEMVRYLLPKWHGKYGEWQSFARQACQSTGGSEGEFLYACLAWRADAEGQELFLGPAPVDWPLMRSGFAEVVRRYPTEHSQKHFLYFACLAEDRPTAQRLFATAPFKTSVAPWRNEGEVAAWKAWSTGGPLPSQRAAHKALIERLMQDLERYRQQQQQERSL